jgi:hypothetical protein
MIEAKGMKRMPEWFWIVVFLAGYFILMRWVLPGLGIPT